MRKLLKVARYILRIKYAVTFWLERRIRRASRRVAEKLRSLFNPVLAVLASTGYWLERRFRRISRWASQRLHSIIEPISALLTDFTSWLGNRLRRMFGWVFKQLKPVVAPIADLWHVASRWIERRFGKFFRRCAEIMRPVLAPFEAAYDVVAYWVGRRLERLRKINLRKALLVTALVLVVLSVLGYWQGRPLYRKVKERRFLGLAHLFMQKGEDVKAVFSARNALAYNPKNVEATEILADLMDRFQSPQALIWRRRVVELAPTPDNRLRLADSALRCEAPPFPLAAKTLDELGAADKQTVPFHLLSARFALQLNQGPKAESHFEEAIRLDPTNELHRLNLAVLRLRSTNTVLASNSRTTLEGLRTNAAVGAEALRWLISDSLGRKDFPTARRFSDQLLSNARSAFSDRLLHLSLLEQTQSADLGTALQSVQQHWATNAVQAAEVGKWMIAHRQAREARQWLQSLPEAIRSRQPVPFATASCFEASEDWRGLRDFLRERNWGDQDFIRLALLARAMKNEGDTTVAAAYWQQALRSAAERAEFTAMLAQTTRSWGWTNETQELLTTLSTRFAAEPWALQYVFQQYHSTGNTQGLFQVFSTALNGQSTNAVARESEALFAVMNSRFAAEPWALWVAHYLFQYYRSTGNTRGVYQILSTVMERGSDDVVAKNNLAVTALLLQTNLPMAQTLARQVYEREPANPYYVSTYAYSLHLQGKTAEALTLMQKLKSADLEISSIATYYGCLLAASGQSARANEYLALVDTSRLLPEERELVAQAKRKASASGLSK